ncbi:hypothetical protein VIS19158_15691 [Vibrio scophthalmi LMG 19158]|uniref:Uncharacterized protein n=1 Tax=Vibrio scophthalmi LMG 19158 TaxID=870967 RepID=F9RKF7_9VIBR|nr:hypothetical protein VIS19158_15691 [Vibrio scophthalmi LMG 19158]
MKKQPKTSTQYNIKDLPISRSKSRLLKQVHYDYHPLTLSLIELDTFTLRTGDALSLLSDEQLVILLREPYTFRPLLTQNAIGYCSRPPRSMF